MDIKCEHENLSSSCVVQKLYDKDGAELWVLRLMVSCRTCGEEFYFALDKHPTTFFDGGKILSLPMLPASYGSIGGGDQAVPPLASLTLEQSPTTTTPNPVKHHSQEIQFGPN